MLIVSQMQDIYKRQNTKGGINMSYYIHGVTGRLRVKTPVVRGSQYKAEEVQQLLKTIRGIMSVTVAAWIFALHISRSIASPQWLINRQTISNSWVR